MRLVARTDIDRQKYAHDPVGFAKDVLGIVFSPSQVAITTVWLLDPRVVIHAPVASGLSTLHKCLTIWHLTVIEGESLECALLKYGR